MANAVNVVNAAITIIFTNNLNFKFNFNAFIITNANFNFDF